jgi:hypothetical protein
MPTGHRVERKRERSAPPVLPKEVIEVAPRTYEDRWGVQFVVQWDGRKDDGYLFEASAR